MALVRSLRPLGLLAVVAAASTPAAHAQGAAASRRAMTWLDMQHMRTASAPALSADGKWMLYTVSVPDWKVKDLAKFPELVWLNRFDTVVPLVFALAVFGFGGEAPASGAGRAYIGVGPDQNYTYIAKVRPKIAYMIDLRRDNLLQHLLYKSLFDLSRNRAEYLANLLGRPAPRDRAARSDFRRVRGEWHPAVGGRLRHRLLQPALPAPLPGRHAFAGV